MHQNEALALKKRARHREVLVEAHQNFKGEIIQYFGDGTLSIFTNSMDAVACAVEIQKALREPIEVPLRIGIHSGNVIINDDGIIGDAVNIASRIESFANVGGILVSDTIQDQIKNQSQMDLIQLGKFRLKNVDRLFEIYAVSAPGVKVPPAGFLKGKGEKIALLKGSIPVPATSILGREKDLNQVIGLLAEHKVVTITGTGGMGKTRLSLEVCKRLKSDFRDGIAFVSMATLTDATEVMPTLANTLEIAEAEGRTEVDAVAALIADKKALLVLDNLEQVVSAAREIADLVSKCSNLKILCTSRTPLKIKAEQEFALSPLSLPEKDHHEIRQNPMAYPAIQLFVSRAQRVNPNFELNGDHIEPVIKICRRLDGLPLALELAAARIRILPPDRLLSRLNRALDILTGGAQDLPERHQTLRTTIDWSYSLLNGPEKQLFQRTSVFAGGFTLDAIEQVCYENEDDAFMALDELEALVDNGLVEKAAGGTRFSMLQTINDYAREKLNASGEIEKYQQQHALFYNDICKKMFLATQGVNQLKYMEIGSLEEKNIQSVLDYLSGKAKAGDSEAIELGFSICGDLLMFWHIRGRHLSAITFINAFLNAPDCPAISEGKCRALLTASLASWTLGQFEPALEEAKASYKMAKQISSDFYVAWAAFHLGLFYLRFDMELAVKFAQEAVTRCREKKYKWLLAFALWSGGIVNIFSGELIKAKKKFEESRNLHKETGDHEGMGCALSGLAMLEAMGNHNKEAISYYQQSLENYEVVGDRAEEARVLSEISWVYLTIRDTVSARKYTLESIEAYQEVGSTRGVGLSMICLAAIESIEGHPDIAITIASAAENFAKQEGIVNVYGDENKGKEYLKAAKESLSNSEIEQAVEAGINLSVKDVLEMVENILVPVA